MNARPYFVVVDDDSANNLICRIGLQYRFKTCVVMSFTDPLLGLEHIKECCASDEHKRITLFLDLNMPRMNGWEFLDEFAQLERDQRAKVRIYILSSTIHASDIERAELNPYVEQFLSKPLDKKKISTLFKE